MHLVPPFTGMVCVAERVWCGTWGSTHGRDWGGLDAAKTRTEVVEEAAASGRASGLHF